MVIFMVYIYIYIYASEACVCARARASAHACMHACMHTTCEDEIGLKVEGVRLKLVITKRELVGNEESCMCLHALEL